MKGFCCALCLFFATAIALSQTEPTSQRREPALTIRSRARLVVLDVVVQDREQKPVHNLKLEDFVVTESGNPQTISAFQEHVALSPDQAAKFPPLPHLPPGVFTNFTPAPANSSMNVLLLDSLNTPLQDQDYMRHQLLDYLKHARPGTRVAIFALTTRLIMLQGFTSDPELLKQIAEKKLGKASPLLEDQVGQQPQQSLTDLASSFGMPMSGDVSASLQMMQQDVGSLKLDIRAKYTLQAMNLLARYLANIPGRKNVIWFSGSFPVNLLPTTSGSFTNPFEGAGNEEEQFRETINLLARTQVAIYPIDARGIKISSSFDMADSSFRNGPATLAGEQNFSQQLYSEHDTMQRLAQSTGGHAFYNVNNLSRAMDMAIQDGSNYYTLEYIPTNADAKSTYRKIQVKLAQKGYTLSYRPGYFTDDPATNVSALTVAPDPVQAAPDSPPAATASTPAGVPKVNTVLHNAMVHGYPPSTEILYKLLVQPASKDTEETVAPGNVDIFPRFKPVAGPFRRYSIDYAAVARDITFTDTPDGMHHATIEFISLVYDPDGKLVNMLTNRAQANVDAVHLKDLMRTGVHYHQEISVPVKGVYTVRTAVHDLNSNRIGIIEVPVELVKNLPTSTAEAAPAPH